MEKEKPYYRENCDNVKPFAENIILAHVYSIQCNQQSTD
jgi:hypothetical protein